MDIKTSQQRIEAGEFQYMKVTSTFVKETYIKVPKDLPFCDAALQDFGPIEDEISSPHTGDLGAPTEIRSSLVSKIPDHADEYELDGIDLEELDEWIHADIVEGQMTAETLKSWEQEGT